MSDEEFYHKDIFGNVVDIDLLAEEELGDVGKSASDFNIFSLTDAIGSRDKKKAWMLYQKALASGLDPDRIFPTIFWQVKSLLLASRTKSASEADMKPFPYNKAKSNLKNFKEGELEKMSEELLVGYHNIRRGEGEMETLLEKFVLSL